METEPTKEDIDALVGPATPHFAYQIRARVRERIEVVCPRIIRSGQYGEEQIELLDRLGYASSKAEEGQPEPSTAPAGRGSRLGARGRPASPASR